MTSRMYDRITGSCCATAFAAAWAVDHFASLQIPAAIVMILSVSVSLRTYLKYGNGKCSDAESPDH